MVLITGKFWGPSGAENVIGSVHMWLAEAIGTLQDNKDTLTAKVRAGATRRWEGAPLLQPTWAQGSLLPSRTAVVSLGHPGLREPQGQPPGHWA